MSRATALATAGDDPNDIVRASLDALERVFDAVRADVWRLDDAGDLHHVAGRGVGGDAAPVASEHLAAVARDGLGQELPSDALGDDDAGTAAWRRLLFQAGCRELGVYALASHGRSIGCITLFRKADCSQVGEELAAFASAVASAVLQATARRDAANAAEAAKLQSDVLTELASCQGPECVARVLGRVVGQVDAAATVHLVVASVGGRTARLTTKADARRGGRPRHVGSTILDSHARGALALVDADPAVLDAPTRALFGWGDDVAHGDDLLGVAMRAGDESVGWLVVEASDEESVAPLLTLLATISPAVSVSLVTAMKFTAMQLRSERLAAANALARSLGSITEFGVLVERLAIGIEGVLGCTRVAVYDEALALLVDHGTPTGPRAELRLVRAALREHGSQHRSGSEGVDAFSVPLEHLGTTRAVLYVERPDAVGASFDDHDRGLLENVAEQANATLAVIAACDDLEQNYLSTIQALAGALEASDQYTHDHAQDVAKWALEVGRRLGMDARDLRDLELGAVFHDIGKIAIPNEILNKPGKLTDAEFEVMKTHTIVGERIIAPISFLERVRPIVRHEHERWDGRGYPDGISGEQIPLGSRIIFVCDAYHAITSTRPYRQAQPHSVARQVLVENAGTQFDPAVVSVFLDVIEDHLGGQGTLMPLNMPEAHEPARIDIAPARAGMVHRQTDVDVHRRTA